MKVKRKIIHIDEEVVEWCEDVRQQEGVISCWLYPTGASEIGIKIVTQLIHGKLVRFDTSSRESLFPIHIVGVCLKSECSYSDTHSILDIPVYPIGRPESLTTSFVGDVVDEVVEILFKEDR